jgi:hypothetical protein
VSNGRAFQHTRRRRRRVRRDTFSNLEPTEYPYASTFPGRMERLGRLARMANRSRGWRRVVLKGLFLLPVLALLCALLWFLLAFVLGWGGPASL